MLTVKITDAKLAREKTGTGKNNKPYHIREQAAYVSLPGKPFPVEVMVSLRDGQQPYEPGDYTLAPESFYVDKFGSLALGLRLAPMAPAVRKVG